MVARYASPSEHVWRDIDIAESLQPHESEVVWGRIGQRTRRTLTRTGPGSSRGRPAKAYLVREKAEGLFLSTVGDWVRGTETRLHKEVCAGAVVDLAQPEGKNCCAWFERSKAAFLVQSTAGCVFTRAAIALAAGKVKERRSGATELDRTTIKL